MTYAVCTGCASATRLTPKLALEIVCRPESEGAVLSFCCVAPIRLEERPS